MKQYLAFICVAVVLMAPRSIVADFHMRIYSLPTTTTSPPPPSQPPDTIAHAFTLNATSFFMMVADGCALFPASTAITVSGLGDGVAVEATLTPVSIHATLYKNSVNVTSPINVRNNDILRINVCANGVFDLNQTFQLNYGGQRDTLTVFTSSALALAPLSFVTISETNETLIIQSLQSLVEFQNTTTSDFEITSEYAVTGVLELQSNITSFNSTLFSESLGADLDGVTTGDVTVVSVSNVSYSIQRRLLSEISLIDVEFLIKANLTFPQTERAMTN
jgi:hypothetical protein